ncbi:hypothetical protein KGM_211237 [Danaus plexippus plexippus]|uniref:CLIP domain-containing serine protease n=1 Tax=Danaus plexippus plexippus TaxID=278856 RepID=A0A212FEW0_DANPL|nr:hypothetical protein KGM_211237 [Danaus plexippus plexippus]
MDKIILAIPLTIVIIATVYSDIIEAPNQYCKTKFTNGTCVKVTDCPYALTLIYKHDYDTLSNLTCGFNKHQPQVCCPQQDFPILYDTKEEPATNRPKPMNLKPVATTTFSPHIETKNDSSNVLPNKTICGKVKNKGVSDRIVGGSVVEVDEHPWLARIQHKFDDNTIFGCSAALITNLYLLTAAHCVQNHKIIPFSVRLGEWNTKTDIDCRNNICNNSTVDININKIIVHPKYDGKLGHNSDIALIRLRDPVNFTDFIQPICLPASKYIAMQDSVINNAYWTAGWGETEYEEESVIKRQVQLNSVPIEICRAHFKVAPETEPNIICAGGIKGKDTCNGDSGGPLVKIESENYEENWYMFGITSSGSKTCGREGVPGIYTRVTSYIDWILENVKE